jgi:septal ring factor EnvC (AmiA/AmiB activator)
MRSPGHRHISWHLAIFLSWTTWSNPLDSSDHTPSPTPVPRGEIELSVYADRTNLDPAAVGAEPGLVVITNDTVESASQSGSLTVGAPQNRPSHSLPRSGSTIAPEAAKLRKVWRSRVLTQRDQVAKVQREIDRLDGRIDALESMIVSGRSGMARRRAKIDELRGHRNVLVRQFQRERARLGALIRSARLQGAEPGWFR